MYTWHFCSDCNTKKMEKAQERALRFVYEDFSSSYEDFLHKKTGIPSLHIRRMRIMAIEVFKILNELCPPVLSNLVQKRSSSYNFRYTNILQVPTVKTNLFGKRSFKYATPVLWNSLTDDLRQCSIFNQFKGLILLWIAIV